MSCRIYFGTPHTGKKATGLQQVSSRPGRREYQVGCRNKFGMTCRSFRGKILPSQQTIFLTAAF